jgi:two-component system NarL family sensor kinase
VLALTVTAVPLGILARQGVSAGSGSLLLGPVFGVVGFVVAWRRPRNPMGWLMLGAVAFLVLSGDTGSYAVADYRLRHGGLPLGWVAVLLQPCWAPAIALFGLTVPLFPDGRLPSLRWRWMLWVYVAVAAAWIGGVVYISAGAIIGHNVQVDSGGNLLILDNPTGSAAWWGAVQRVFFPVLGVFWLASVVGQALSYRRSSGERRLQLKWLVGGSAVAIAGGVLGVPLSGSPSKILHIVGSLGIVAVLALPVSMGVAILKYRLYDIDRLISRTLAYAIVTGLLVGVYAAVVALAGAASFSSPVEVAAATLTAAALFNSLRRRVQKGGRPAVQPGPV